ncbi:DUF6029 family protein [Candidatus Marinimicrobia bacterium]|nr:DUF6029 family protein [Candidatus Neomarinimicrobiota bacterium]
MRFLKKIVYQLLNNKKYFIYLLLYSFTYMQDQSIVSYEMKLADGDSKSPNFFENIIDFNYFYNNGVYLFSQFEFSSPPLIGEKKWPSTDILGNTINIFYLQYSTPNYDLTLGNLYLLYGRGLSMHTFEDQDIDYDNSIRGIDFNYNLNNKITLQTSLGSTNIKSRTNPADIIPSLSIENDVFTFGGIISLDNLNMHYYSIAYSQAFDYKDINSLLDLTNILGQYMNSRADYFLDTEPSYSMNNFEHNLGFDFNIGPMDYYIETSKVYYNKISGERTQGYKHYLSSYINLYDFDLSFEFKDYNTPYLYNTFSTPPIAFRETTSVLASRNLHTIDFSNEYGYLLELNRSFENNLNLLISYSFALHHIDGEKDYNVFTSDDILNFSDYWPYKQYYIESSIWSLDGKSYYKLAYDYYHEVIDEKTILAKTIPIQFSYNFKTGNSLALYFEIQDKVITEEIVQEESIVLTSKESKYMYITPTYNHFGKWTVSLFSDYEKNDKTIYGADYTFNYNNSQISFFLGSQKGGLVCANGSCIMQPDFTNGFKVTYRATL